MSDKQKVTALQVLPSKIVQISAAYDDVLCALCEDGSVWAYWRSDFKWHQVSPAHVANRQQPSAATDETQRKAWLWDVLWSLRAKGRIYASVPYQGQRYADNAEDAADLLERLAGEVKP
jgi:hypothetical protein